MVLNGFAILVVEDEFAIAMPLVDAIENLQGCPIGPAATVVEGLALLSREHIAAAIVDANLMDRDVTPLALALVARGIPFVVHTGKGLPAELAALHPDLPVIMKPAKAIEVLATLLHHVSPDRELFRTPPTD